MRGKSHSISSHHFSEKLFGYFVNLDEFTINFSHNFSIYKYVLVKGTLTFFRILGVRTITPVCLHKLFTCFQSVQNSFVCVGHKCDRCAHIVLVVAVLALFAVFQFTINFFFNFLFAENPAPVLIIKNKKRTYPASVAYLAYSL